MGKPLSCLSWLFLVVLPHPYAPALTLEAEMTLCPFREEKPALNKENPGDT